MTYEYGKPLIGMALGDQRLFTGVDFDWETRWEPLQPEATAVLWRYMSFAKFCSLLECRKLFFSLVGDMADSYEGFICPLPRDQKDPILKAEELARDILGEIARSALISCWTKSDYESALMWESYADTEGVAIRTTYEELQKSIPSNSEFPITVGQVKYVDYGQWDVPRFGWAPLFHKRMEYRSEEEVRLVLPGPPWKFSDIDPATRPKIRLDPDVIELRGRYVPVDLGVLIKDVVVSPHAGSWFAEVVKSVVRRSDVAASVMRSAI